MTATSAIVGVLVTPRLSMKITTPARNLESASIPAIAWRTSSYVTAPCARMMNSDGSSKPSATGIGVSLPRRRALDHHPRPVMSGTVQRVSFVTLCRIVRNFGGPLHVALEEARQHCRERADIDGLGDVTV